MVWIPAFAGMTGSGRRVFRAAGVEFVRGQIPRLRSAPLGMTRGLRFAQGDKAAAEGFGATQVRTCSGARFLRFGPRVRLCSGQALGRPCSRNDDVWAGWVSSFLCGADISPLRLDLCRDSGRDDRGRCTCGHSLLVGGDISLRAALGRDDKERCARYEGDGGKSGILARKKEGAERRTENTENRRAGRCRWRGRAAGDGVCSRADSSTSLRSARNDTGGCAWSR